VNKELAGQTDKQIKIVESARRIISLKGIEKLTIHEMAKDLGVTDGALYRHFKSKKEIISFLIADIEKTLLDTIGKAAGSNNDSGQKLKNILASHLSYAEQRKGVSFIIINETLSFNDKELRRKMFGVIHKYLGTIKAILAEGIKQGDFRKELDLSSASVAFFGMVQSMVTLWALGGFEHPLGKSRIDEMMNIYNRGVVA
jgi:AcrR family transcriptional regulator